MKIIGRKAEIRELERCEKSNKSELVCVFGRRRVGKTFLVEQTFSGHFTFRATGIETGNTRMQLRAFHQRLKDHGDISRKVPQNWFEAFSRLENLLEKQNVRLSSHGKKLVFLDEFPWFATARSDFLSAFGEFWNRCGTIGGNYCFIICGSATSWIINNVLKDSGSLYNRVTNQIFLSPFSLKETEDFMSDRNFGWSRKQIAECHMVFGGLPYFLDLLNPNESLNWNISSLCLNQHAILGHESKKLLEATLKKSDVYSRILEHLSEFFYGTERSSCREKLNIPSGTFSRAVKELAECGYIQEFKSPYSQGKAMLLRLCDPFLLFHYKFISRNVQDYKENSGYYMDWRGHAFEILCLSHIRQIKAALGIAGIKTSEYSWISRKKKGGAQIDLVIERADGITDICEAKFTDTPFSVSADYEKNLMHKIEVFREESGSKDALKLVMICSEGISGSAYTENISRVLTLDDLFD